MDYKGEKIERGRTVWSEGMDDSFIVADVSPFGAALLRDDRGNFVGKVPFADLAVL